MTTRPHSTTVDADEPVVITGIGMIAALGDHREAVWEGVQRGRSGVRRVTGLPGIPDGLVLGAPAHVELDFPGQLKVLPLAMRAAFEAMADSKVRLVTVDRDRFGCAISAHVGDMSFVPLKLGRTDMVPREDFPWWDQFLPNTACVTVARHFGLMGPRMCHSTACASGLVDVISAVRAIRTDQCDIALAGAAEAFHPLFAAGFRQLRVLAEHEDPTQACRPFDSQRTGFVMGEGSAMFVLERLSHALARGAKIYAEVLGTKMMADAHHVTGVDADADSLAELLTQTLIASRLQPGDVTYINAHGTGTQQNDVSESRAIRRALGQAADSVWVSSTKASLGHLVNASGAVELALTTLALRDGFAPPTMNLTQPDPDCDLDCIPLVGRHRQFTHAMKVSVAFGGNLAAVALRRWPDCASGFNYEEARRAA